MPPPGLAPAPTRWNHSQRGSRAGQPCLDVETLVRAATSSPEVAGLGLGHRKIVRVVRSFIASGLHERDLVAYVVGYADPTGETAVRNVMRGGGRR
jgi:hypothetical protein